MLAIYNWQTLSVEEKQQKLARPLQIRNCKTQVKSIISAVQEYGDQALVDFTQAFDGVSLTELKVPIEEIMNAEVNAKTLDALNQAIETIRYYHEATMPGSQKVITAGGIAIERIYKPISKVGLYVPGGNNTPLISSLLMQAIPAEIAGCANKVLCTPPNELGKLDPVLLVAARLCNIDTIYKVGGAQAIAAMAYGTESISKMDKLFGPGNAYVTEAKAQVAADPQGAAIDMPAGPSEVLVVADCEANPAFVAADLLAQAEHGVDSQVFLICETSDFANRVNFELQKQLTTLSRKTIIQQALQHGAIFICENRKEQLAIINNYAPEHLILNRLDAQTWLADIESAGTIFLGAWAAETMGDYVTGSNHVLPTNGYARTESGLSIYDFLKTISVQTISKAGLSKLGTAAEILARVEGLDAHANAVRIRLETMEF